MNIVIPNCFDSHVHLLGTGEARRFLDLRNLKSAEDVLNLDLKPQHYRNGWVFGRGWDQNLWANKEFPSASYLDKKFPQTPVCFYRVDGHGAWINSAALR